MATLAQPSFALNQPSNIQETSQILENVRELLGELFDPETQVNRQLELCRLIPSRLYYISTTDSRVRSLVSQINNLVYAASKYLPNPLRGRDASEANEIIVAWASNGLSDVPVWATPDENIFFEREKIAVFNLLEEIINDPLANKSQGLAEFIAANPLRALAGAAHTLRHSGREFAFQDVENELAFAKQITDITSATEGFYSFTIQLIAMGNSTVHGRGQAINQYVESFKNLMPFVKNRKTPSKEALSLNTAYIDRLRYLDAAITDLPDGEWVNQMAEAQLEFLSKGLQTMSLFVNFSNESIPELNFNNWAETVYSMWRDCLITALTCNPKKSRLHLSSHMFDLQTYSRTLAENLTHNLFIAESDIEA